MSNLKPGTSEEQVRSIFSRHGLIESVVLGKAEHASSLTATITFRTCTATEAASTAVSFFMTPENLGRVAPEVGHVVVQHGTAPAWGTNGSGHADGVGAPMSQAPPHSSSQSYPQQPPPAPSAQQPPNYGYDYPGPLPPMGHYMQAPYPGPQSAASYGGYSTANVYHQQHAPPYQGYRPPPQQYPGGGWAAPPRHNAARGGAGNAPAILSGVETKLFIGGLPFDATEELLRGLFGAYGNLVDIHVMNPSSTTNQRCAFVTCVPAPMRNMLRVAMRPYPPPACKHPLNLTYRHWHRHLGMQACFDGATPLDLRAHSFDSHASALAATKELGGVHKINPNDKPIVVRFADSQGSKRQRSY